MGDDLCPVADSEGSGGHSSRSALGRFALAVGLSVAAGLTAAAAPQVAVAQPLSCSSPAPTGCFDVTVTGPTGQAQVKGFAQSFGSRADRKWYTQLVAPGGASSFTLMYSGDVRPHTGQHDIVDNHQHAGDPPDGNFIGAGSVEASLGVPDGFHSLSGTVVVTRSEADWVEGTFSYTGVKAQTGENVTVAGAFKAKNTDM